MPLTAAPPVANAFGCSPGVRYRRGIGISARALSSRTVACTSGACAAASGCGYMPKLGDVDGCLDGGIWFVSTRSGSASEKIAAVSAGTACELSP